MVTKTQEHGANLMEDDSVRGHHGHGTHHPPSATQSAGNRHHHQGTFRLAVSATIHCLVGCGIGEVAGMIIAAALGFDMLASMIVAIVLGFIAGLALGVVPLMKTGFTLSDALKTVIVAEGLSIGVMEAFEVVTQIFLPGVMSSGLTDGIFWIGMIAGLAAGFLAALPVNYVMIKRGVRHRHHVADTAI